MNDKHGYVREFLDSVRQKGDDLGLETMYSLLDTLGNPQEKLNVIQVAGTNGKGSICTFISEILIKSGYRVGVFTSPAVFSERERYVVDNTDISWEEYDDLFLSIIPYYTRMVEKGDAAATIFELETAAAIIWFIRKKCDICIFETGMGGDRDATNVFPNQVMAVFSSIGLDHMQFLGSSVSEIAQHKAGIINKNGIVVSSGQCPEAGAVLLDAAKREDADIFFSRPDDFSYALSMEGNWQIENAAAALMCVNKLRDLGFNVPEKAVVSGFKEAHRPGRMERIGDNPPIYIDGAHNIPAFLVLSEELRSNPLFVGKRITLIMGVLSDKAVEEMLGIILPCVSNVVCISAVGSRAMPGSKLCEIIRSYGFMDAVYADSCKNALEKALSFSPDIVVCAGSLTILRGIKEKI